MHDSRDIIKYTGWYLSYAASSDPQGKALDRCLDKYLKYSSKLLSDIEGELELRDEYSDNMILDSIKTMLQQFPEIKESVDGFEWYVDWRE